MKARKKAKISKALHVFLIGAASFYLTFLVDTYTLNTIWKRIFVFCYFLIACSALVFFKNQFFQLKRSKKEFIFSVSAAVVAFAAFHGQLLPHCQEVLIYLSATESNIGEIWLSEVQVDGQEIAVSEVRIEENSNWIYSEEYDDYVFYPNENSSENHLTLKFIAEDILLRFAANAWSGNVCVADSFGNYSEYDLHIEDPEVERIEHVISAYKADYWPINIIHAFGALVVLMYCFSICFCFLTKICGKVNSSHRTPELNSEETMIFHNKPAVEGLLKYSGVILSSIYLTSIIGVYFLNTALEQMLAFFCFCAVCMIFIWLKKRFLQSKQTWKQMICVYAAAFLLVLAFQSAFLPNKQKIQVRLQGYEGEVWLTDIVIDQRNIDISKVRVLENSGWLYNEVYDDYVYFPDDGNRENFLQFEIVASEAEVCFASNSWSGEVGVTDSLGGDSHYLLWFDGGFTKTICHGLNVPSISIIKKCIYGLGCVIIVAFLMDAFLYYLFMIKNDHFLYREGRIPLATIGQMEEWQSSAKEKRCGIYKSLLAHFTLLIIIYRVMLLTRFSPDGYGGILNFENDSGAGSLSLGRLSSYFIKRFLQLVKFNPMEHQGISAILLCLIIAGSVTFVSAMILQQIQTSNMLLRFIVHASVLLSFVNVFYVELFYFSDGMILWGCGLLFCVFALCTFWKINGCHSVVFTILLLYISFGFYQAYLGFFIIFGSILIVLEYVIAKDKDIKTVLIRWISLLFCGGTASVFILLTMKIMVMRGISDQTERSPTLDWHMLINNIKKIYFEQYRILVNGMSYLKWGIGITLAVLVIALAIALIRYNISIRKCMVIGMLFAVDYIIVFAPHIIAQAVWLQPRTLCSYFSLFTYGFILIAAINYVYSNKIPSWVPIWLSVFIIINIFKVQTIGIEQCVSNAQDRIEACEIVENIEKYEAENNIKVDTIRVHYDAYVTWGYEGVKYAFEDVNRRIEHVAWALGDCLQYYTGRQFYVETTTDEKHMELFQEQNWKHLIPEEQFVFEDEILYIAAY